MDIEKERKEFEKEAFKQSGGWATFHKAYGDVYENNQLNFGWKVWLAAKLDAVPEGFVLVPKVPSEEILPISSLYEILDCQECCDAGGFCQERYIQIIEGISKAMVEAQEQSHD